jgi:hypothetical protein
LPVRGAGDRAVPVLADQCNWPGAEQRPVEATRLAEVDILDRGRLPRFCNACACFKPRLLA